MKHPQRYPLSNSKLRPIVVCVCICLTQLCCLLIGCKKHTIVFPTSTGTTSSTHAACDTCLPPITTQGNNTFGCKINGKNWVPEDDLSTIGLRIDIWENTLSIIAKNAKTIEGVTINMAPIFDTGLFIFPTNALTYARGKYSQNYISMFEEEPLKSGFIHFTKVDYQRAIFSGTFAFDLYNDHGDTMHITEGRFDVKK